MVNLAILESNINKINLLCTTTYNTIQEFRQRSPHFSLEGEHLSTKIIALKHSLYSLDSSVKKSDLFATSLRFHSGLKTFIDQVLTGCWAVFLLLRKELPDLFPGNGKHTGLLQNARLSLNEDRIRDYGIQIIGYSKGLGSVLHCLESLTVVEWLIHVPESKALLRGTIPHLIRLQDQHRDVRLPASVFQPFEESGVGKLNVRIGAFAQSNEGLISSHLLDDAGMILSHRNHASTSESLISLIDEGDNDDAGNFVDNQDTPLADSHSLQHAESANLSGVPSLDDFSQGQTATRQLEHGGVTTNSDQLSRKPGLFGSSDEFATKKNTHSYRDDTRTINMLTGSTLPTPRHDLGVSTNLRDSSRFPNPAQSSERPADVPPSDEMVEEKLSEMMSQISLADDPSKLLGWAEDVLRHLSVIAAHKQRLENLNLERGASLTMSSDVQDKLKAKAILLVRVMEWENNGRAHFLHARFLAPLEDQEHLHLLALEQGHCRSQFYLAQLAEKRNDVQLAMERYRAGVAREDAACLYRLALANLERQLGFRRNMEEGRRLLKAAGRLADPDCPDPRYDLAILRYASLSEKIRFGVQRPLAQPYTQTAIVYLRDAALFGHGPSQLLLGQAYRYGVLDLKEAKSAAKGSDTIWYLRSRWISESILPTAPEIQRNVKIDSECALHYLRLASHRGLPEADYEIASMLLLDDNLSEESQRLAYTHVVLAFHGGVPLAYGLMGHVLEHGIACNRNLALAEEYYFKGGATGDAWARERADALQKSNLGLARLANTWLPPESSSITPRIEFGAGRKTTWQPEMPNLGEQKLQLMDGSIPRNHIQDPISTSGTRRRYFSMQAAVQATQIDKHQTIPRVQQKHQETEDKTTDSETVSGTSKQSHGILESLHGQRFDDDGTNFPDIDADVKSGSYMEDVVSEPDMTLAPKSIKEEPAQEQSIWDQLAEDLKSELFPPSVTAVCFEVLAALVDIDIHVVQFPVSAKPSPIERFQRLLERRTKTKWLWWPLLDPQDELELDAEYIEWPCNCGAQQRAQAPHELVVRLKLLQAASASSASSQSSTGNGGTSTDDISSSQTSLAPTGNDEDVRSVKRRGTDLDGEFITSSMISPGKTTISFAALFIFLVTKVGRYYKLSQMKVQDKNDDDFFLDLKCHYLKARTWFRRCFSIWKYAHCDFYLFRKMEPYEVVALVEDIPEEDNPEYEFTPCKLNPKRPIAQGEFHLRFYECYRGGQRRHRHHFRHCRKQPRPKKDYLARIPKRLSNIIEESDESEVFWGLLAVEEPAFWMVAAYQVLFLAGPFVFWGLWVTVMKHDGDLQNASIPFLAALGLMSAFWFPFLHRTGAK